jgi:hypothetical protein
MPMAALLSSYCNVHPNGEKPSSTRMNRNKFLVILATSTAAAVVNSPRTTDDLPVDRTYLGGHFARVWCRYTIARSSRILLMCFTRRAPAFHGEERKRVRREHVKVARDKRFETQGLPAAQKVELTQGRTLHSCRTENHKNDPAARTQASNRSVTEKCNKTASQKRRGPVRIAKSRPGRYHTLPLSWTSAHTGHSDLSDRCGF